MKISIQQIEKQLLAVQVAANNVQKNQAEGVLNGLCEAYFSMGIITRGYWDDVLRRANNNSLPSIYQTMLEDNDWLIPYN
jgi:hypothetical protein